MVFIGDDMSNPVKYRGFFLDTLKYQDPYWNKPKISMESNKGWQHSLKRTVNLFAPENKADCQKEKMIFQPYICLVIFSVFWWFSIPPSKKIPSKYHQMLVSGIWIFFGDSVVIPTFTVENAWRPHT